MRRRAADFTDAEMAAFDRANHGTHLDEEALARTLAEIFTSSGREAAPGACPGAAGSTDEPITQEKVRDAQ